MSQPFIRIPKPCSQSWDNMTSARGGRHCEACQKVVVDFTQLTDNEVLAYFQQLTGDSTCGRFRADQVGRPLVILPPRPPRRWQPWLAGVLATTLALQACDPTTRTAPRPPLAHTSKPLVLDSAAISSASFFPDDSTFEVPVATDSLIHDIVVGFTVTPEPARKSRP